nr:hypothetical protein [Tanacetum cinerariifolium]
MKVVRSSSPVSIVPSLSLSSHVFASPVSDRGNIIRQTTSFSMSVFKYFTYFEEFVNVFVRIDFGSTIKLVSLDESQVVTFNGKLVCGFKNGNCGTESQSDNTIGSPHGFIIYWIIISMNIKEVTKVTDVENWRIDNSQASIPILELTPTNKELKEPWLIRSLSYTRGEDVPFTQVVRPGENVDEAPNFYEQSIEIEDKSGAIDD